MSYNYLASPYTHPSPQVMGARYEAALAALGWLLKRKIWTYSPIVHCHPLALRDNLPVDANYWAEFNKAMLQPAKVLLVLEIEGWDISRGIKAEMDLARDESIRVSFLRPGKAGRYQIIPYAAVKETSS